jgi:hypothetical protein
VARGDSADDSGVATVVGLDDAELDAELDTDAVAGVDVIAAAVDDAVMADPNARGDVSEAGGIGGRFLSGGKARNTINAFDE